MENLLGKLGYINVDYASNGLEAIEAANLFIQNDRDVWNGLYLFREIIRQGFGFDEAIEAVNKFIEEPHYRSLTYLLYAEAVIRRTFYNPLGLLKWS